MGDAGGVTITTGSLNLTNGGRVDASTLGQGDAGSVEITASDTITIDGEDSDGFPSRTISQVGSEAVGNAGGVTINTNSLTLTNRGEVSASTFGQGSGGNIFLNVNDDLNLDNGQISATNQPPQPIANPEDRLGGNIELQVENNLILRNNSEISAEATENANGGNVDIDTQFIIAFPSQPPGDGNDIVASAEFGMGGNIDITAESLFGIEERPAEPRNGTNDIDASSEFGLDGDVFISNPDTNVRQIDTEVPKNIVEPETLGINACSGGGETEASSFTIKGKGGIPPAPIEPFMADALIPDGKPITIDKETDLNSLLVEERETEQLDPYYIPPDIKPIKTSMGDIYPARGIIKTEDGEIILTVYPTDNINTRTPHNSANCNPL